MTREQEPRPEPILFEGVIRGAKESILRDGRHTPTVIADGSRQPIILQLAVLAPSHEDRLNQMFVAGAVIAQDQRVGRLRRVFFISEGWMSVAQEGRLPDTPPSQDPNRKEVLLISGYTPNTRQTDMAIIEMLRDQEGVLRELRDFKPVEENQEQTENPLLEAFVRGFASGRDFH